MTTHRKTIICLAAALALLCGGCHLTRNTVEQTAESAEAEGVAVQSRLPESANDLFDRVDNTQLHLIPSAQFEEVIRSCFDISSEQIRALSDFSESLDGYYMCGFFTGYYSVMPRIPEPEVTDYRYNGDGTLTLMVDAVYPWYGTDRAFTHELTVRDTETGFEYVSNYVYESGDNIFPEATLQGERAVQIGHLA